MAHPIGGLPPTSAMIKSYGHHRRTAPLLPPMHPTPACVFKGGVTLSFRQ
jgi:hypothetical protein